MKLSLSLKGYVRLCTLALTAPALSFAADMVVTAQPQEDSTSPTQGYLATTSQGATKSDRPLITTPQSISVVTRQQMQDQGALTLNQALGYSSGVFTNFGVPRRVTTLFRYAASMAAIPIIPSSTACD